MARPAMALRVSTVPLAVLLVWLAAVVFIALVGTWQSTGRTMALEWIGAAAFVYLGLSLTSAVMHVFVVMGRQSRQVVPFLCLATAAVVTEVIDRWRWRAGVTSVVVALFVVLFAVFLSLLTDVFVQLVSSGPTTMATMWGAYVAGEWHVAVARDWHVMLVMAGAGALGMLAAKYVGVNEFSLHAMYRNRLVRAYLGASRGDARKPDTFIGLDPDDDVELSATATPGRPRRLFHVVNVALNLVSGDELA